MRELEINADFADTIGVIYEDEDLLVVNKPAHCETVDAANSRADLTAALRQEFDDNLSPAHRLDRDTTGTQLFAKNPQTLMVLQTLFKERRTTKFYLAICAGILANKSGVIRRNLSEWQGGRRPVSVVKRGGLTAETAYRVLAENADFPAGLIALHPREGRTHQLRVHLAALGRPILGDDQYGDRAANQKIKTVLRRQALHAWRLDINFNEQNFSFTAEIPADFSAAAKMFPSGMPIAADKISSLFQ